jgi:hypothetical protein
MIRRKTTQEFIEEAKLVHKEKYDYTKSIYTCGKDKIVITCPIHGDWLQVASAHLHGRGCRKCWVDSKKTTLEQFINRSNEVHQNKYQYTKSVYINDETKLIVTCSLHGDYLIRPNDHLRGGACKICNKYNSANPKKAFAKQTFLEKARKIHGDKYSYENTNYIDSRTKVTISCRVHGNFEQRPSSHLQGKGCKRCAVIATAAIVSYTQTNSPNGWSISAWKETAAVSKTFDGFKVYVLRLFNDDEKFYKIGRTFNKLKTRTKLIPYDCEVVHFTAHEDAKVIYDLETKLKREYKSFKYVPKIPFGGMQECFTLDLPISHIIVNYPTNYTPEIDDALAPTS